MIAISRAQVDRLGERLRKGGVSDDDFRLLDAYRASFAQAYEETINVIRRSRTQWALTGRPAKSTTSIIEKLRRETIRLSQVQDIAGCRLVVPDVLTQDRIVGRLRSTFAKVAVADRRKQPSHGYRAVHLITTVRNRAIEIQVRTELQHLWAQLSERLSDTLDPTIKYGGGQSTLPAQRLAALSRRIAELEEGETQPGGLQRVYKLGIKQAFREYLEGAINQPARLEEKG
ncbi:MAG TPA: hypothetical protein VG206_00305 [Terriglobia bacterium]|nr:hypothetical protein [Terriglobia bacterium]